MCIGDLSKSGVILNAELFDEIGMLPELPPHFSWCLKLLINDKAGHNLSLASP
jgi:hypothetical protein